MEYISTWRSRFPDSFRLFGGLVDQDRSLSIRYGLVAGALLWAAREESSSEQLSTALATICGTQDVLPLLQMTDLLQRSEPLVGAQSLSRLAHDNESLRKQLDQLLEYFLEDLLQYQLLKPAKSNINVSGNVEGANVVIGGQQVVFGPLVISQTLVQQKVRACPIAPNPPPHFAGRRSEIEQLKQSLSQGRNIAITGIQGMGGIGKTALAQQVAAEMSEFGAVLWASLGPEPTVVSHLLEWARHADPDFVLGDNPLDILVSRVQAMMTDLVHERCHGRVLVILDDVWEGSSVAAARLLAKAAPPNAVYLITTRSQLVAAQLRSSRLELNPLTPQDALQMLRNLLSDYPAIPDDMLLNLAGVIGYHPLAMELAAGQVGLLERPELEIGQLINQYQGGIPAGSPFRDIHLELGEDREDNLELVLSFSYGSLSEVDQVRFRALGVLAYAVPFDQAICRALWKVEPKSCLDVLRHHALLGLSDTVGWYQQHPLLRAYARALLKRSQLDFVRVAEDYTEYMLNITQQFNMLPLENWSQLELYLPHVEEVGSILVATTQTELQLARPAENALRRALSFAVNTSNLLANRRELNHSEWLEMGLTISQRRKDLRYVVFFLNELGQDRFVRGDKPQAIQHWYTALKTAEAADDRQNLALTYMGLAQFYLVSDMDEVPKYLRPAIQLYKDLDNPAGLVGALTLLGEWHASRHHPYEERERGIAVLQGALDIARDAGYRQGIAEVELRLGRLYDTLASRDEAVGLLSKAIDQFQTLGRRDQQGLAHLFLASTYANLEQLDMAHAHLEKALPLFKTTGDRVGQAVTLRNLGELYAHRGHREQALARFAEALPLVHRQTMRFLDEDSDEYGIASCFFSAQYEEVLQLDQVEQFRARALVELRSNRRNRRNDIEIEEERPSGFIPDDLMSFLLTETIRVKTYVPSACSLWSTALQDFIDRLGSWGEPYVSEVQFASALLDITLDRESILPQTHMYASYIGSVIARTDHKQQDFHNPILPDEAVEQYINNTLIARVFQPEHQRDWSIKLRKDRRGAALWGDDAERAFYHAQLAVLSGRLILLPRDNPYHQAFEELLNELAIYETLPLDYFLENTVAVTTVVPQNAASWLNYLLRAQREASRHGEENERAFIEALIQLVQGQSASLPDDNLYQPHLRRAQEAIAHREPLAVPLPRALLAALIQKTVVAKTTDPKTIDVLAGHLATQMDNAREQGHLEDVGLYQAILDLLVDKMPGLPDGSIYEPVLQTILAEIAKGSVQPSANMTIPQSQVDNLVDMVVAARTDTAETQAQARAQLETYRHLVDARGVEWDNERAFADALLAVLDGQHYDLAPANPYRIFYEQALAAISNYEDIQSKGGRILPHQLDALLRETAKQSQSAMDFMGEQLKDLDNFTSMLTDHRLTDMVKEQRQFEETLQRMRDGLLSEEEDWRQEVELLTALIAVVNRQPASLSSENPYYTAFQNMLNEMGYSHGIPDNLNTMALAAPREEFSEHLTGLFSGKTEFLEKLDIALMNTVMAKTIMPDNLQAWAASLERNYQSLVQHTETHKYGSLQSELELIQALQAVLRDESPFLPDAHPYHLHLRQVLESIRIFAGLSSSPYTLLGEQIQRLWVMTAGVMSVGSEYFTMWKDEVEQLRQNLLQHGMEWSDALAFVDALLIILEGRPVDLPLDNPYRPYLHATQEQIKGLRKWSP